ALLPGAGDGADDAGLRVHLPDPVPLALADPHVPVPVKGDAARPVDAGGRRGTAVARELTATGAADGGDDPRFRVHLPDAVVGDVGDVEVALRVDVQGVRL